MLSFLLTLVGLVVLLVTVTGISSGLVLSLNPRSRGDGAIFALMWVPLFVFSLGVLWRDGPTTAVGAVCFAVAAATVALRNGSRLLSRLTGRRSNDRGRETRGRRREARKSG